MADERILTAPTVEQNVNITISGEEKLHDFASTLNDLAENKALNKYWKTQEELIKDVTNACEIYSKNIDNKKNATELLKFANALKAVSGTDLSTLFPNFKDISHYIEQATLKIGSLDKAFSVQNFQKVFESFKTMQAYSLDLDRMFKHFEIKPDVTELENSFKESQSQVTRLTEKIERLRDRLESAESGSGIDVLRQKCEELEYQLDEIHENAQKTFQSFLQLNNLDSYGFSDLTESYVENVKNGYLTAEQAIANFKREYAYLFDDANFDTTQLKDFASTLNQVSNTVSAISDKLENLEFGPGSGSNANNQAINQVSTDIDALLSLLNGIDFQGKSGNIQEMYVALANVLTILKEIAQTDQDSLYSIFGIIQNLAKLDDLKINKTSLDNLANCLERIASIENGNAFNNLSNVDLSKFNDLHITKAPLANLAEYLPSIANINVEILERLSKIDFNNFNELQTNKAVLENLKSFASMLREAFNGVPDEEGNGLEEISKSATAASKAKNSFSDANENVQKSIDESVPKLQAEADLFKGIADNAKAAANAKEKFAKANNSVGNNGNQNNSNSSQKNNSGAKNNQNNNPPVSNISNNTHSIVNNLGHVLKQTGIWGTDKTVSVTIQNIDGLLELRKYKAERNNQGQVLYDKDGNIKYDDIPISTTIANYKELSKYILDADEDLRILRSTKKDILALDSNASTAAIDSRIEKQKEYIKLLEDTYKALVNSDEFLLSNDDLSRLYTDRKNARDKYTSDNAIREEKKNAQSSKKQEEDAAKLKEQNRRKAESENNNNINTQLQNAIKDYTDVVNRMFNGNELPDDLDLARNLYSTIVDLQSNPILTDKQISDAQRKLDKLDEHIQTSKNASLKKELQAINKDEIAYSSKRNSEQQKKWEKFLKEQNDYEKSIAESDAQKRNAAVVNDLNDALNEYARVNSRIAKGQALADDQNWAVLLLEEIQRLQKEPILTKEQVDDSIRKLEKIKSQVDVFEAQSSKKQEDKDNIEKQTLAYNELMNTIHKYERVKKQLAKGEISEKDGNKQLYLLKKDINDLQKNPLLSKKQLQSSEFELQRIDERIVDINKNIQKTNSSKELAERRKLIRDAIKDIDNLKKAATELNNAKASNAKNGDLENYVREKEAEFELAKAQAEKSKNYLNNVDIDGLSQAELSKIIDSLEKFDTAADGSAKSVDNLNKAIQTANQNKLTNIDSFIKSSESYLKQSLNRPGPQDQSELYKEHLADLKTNLNDLKQLKEKVSKQDIVSAEDTNQLDFLQAKVDGLIRSLKDMYASEKGSDSLQRSKLKDTIEQYMNLNSNISKHFKNELKRLINELDFGGPNVNVKALRDEFLALKSAIRGAGQEGKAFLDVVKDKAWYGLAATLGTYFGLDDVINLVQEGARQVINLNSEIVDLAKVSEQTTKQIYENFSDYSSIAKDIGATISDTIDATANWSRNGYNIPDAQDLAEVALIYKNVGDNIDISAANDSLISTLRGFKMEANEAMKIVDVFNEVDKIAS